MDKVKKAWTGFKTEWQEGALAVAIAGIALLMAALFSAMLAYPISMVWRFFRPIEYEALNESFCIVMVALGPYWIGKVFRMTGHKSLSDAEKTGFQMMLMKNIQLNKPKTIITAHNADGSLYEPPKAVSGDQ